MVNKSFSFPLSLLYSSKDLVAEEIEVFEMEKQILNSVTVSLELVKMEAFFSWVIQSVFMFVFYAINQNDNLVIARMMQIDL